MEFRNLSSQYEFLRYHKPLPLSITATRLCISSVLLFTAALLVAYNKTSTNTDPDYQHYHNLFLKATRCNDSIAKHLKELTKQPHVAGTPGNFAAADYVFSVLQNAGLDTHYTDYQVLLTYPLSRSLSLSLSGGQTISLKLKEQPIHSDPTTFSPRVVPTFFAYSPSGDVSAPVVFANYGRDEDYQTLLQMGVDPTGSIVVAKYGGMFRGNIVKIAAEKGAVGVLIYSDPQDYGGNRTEGYYPDSRWLPPSGVQRGSIYTLDGDPLTPGWPSVADAERLSVDDPQIQLPLIPALPISAEDATVIMKYLGGAVAPSEWHGALEVPTYRLGKGDTIVNLHYKSNHTVAPIRDVFAIIKGSEEPDRYVLLGNHRDAWTFGAADPNGGTAVLLQIAQRLGELLSKGWRPRRSIILCNWDAEEYALIGSTEWVEDNYDLLRSSAVAYLNVDVAVIGPGFDPESTPQLDDFIQDLAKEIEDPDNPGKTIYESWVTSAGDSSPQIGRLGGGASDFIPFMQHAGIPATDFCFLGQGLPVYHSLYDDYMWMANFGDPLFRRHAAMGAIWGLAALKLSDAKILPFNYSTYAHELQSYTDVLETQLKAVAAPYDEVSTVPLHTSIAELKKAAIHITKEAKEAEAEEEFNLKVRRSLNDRLLMAERAFTDAQGLPGKPWNKHLIYGPTQTNKYGTTSFPGISDLIATKTSGKLNDSGESWIDVQHQIWRVSRAIRRAALVLRGEFT